MLSPSSNLIGFVGLRDTVYYIAHWAEPDYGLSARQHAVLPEGEGTVYNSTVLSEKIMNR